MLPDLGVGAVYWPELDELFAPDLGLVDVIEIEPQPFWYPGEGEAPHRVNHAALDRLRAFPQRKIIHGVGFPVGGTSRPDARAFAPMRETIARLEAPWASEHLAFNQARGPTGEFHTGFLLPPRQTIDGVEAAASSIRAFASALPVPFAVETAVNYLGPRDDELSDGAFLSAVVSAADCGILLDLHNIWTNERNGRQRVDDFLAEIPLDRVWEIHVAGGMERSGYWLDAHSGPMPREILALLRSIIGSLPNLHAIIFEMLPAFYPSVGKKAIQAELEAMREIWALRRTGPAAAPRRKVEASIRAATASMSPAAWEDALGALVIGRGGGAPEALATDPGTAILRELAAEARAGMIVSSLKLTSRLVFLTVGAARYREILGDFFREAPPALFGSDEMEAFAAHLSARRLDVPHLHEILAFERALLHTSMHREAVRVPFSCDPGALLAALVEGRLPEAPAAGGYDVVVAVDADGGLRTSVYAANSP